jgi:hypothetical protein
LGDLLRRIEKEDMFAILADERTTYSVRLLRKQLGEDELDRGVCWDRDGNVYGLDWKDRLGKLLYTYREVAPWRPRGAWTLWWTAAAELGWGWIWIVMWMIVWIGGVAKAQANDYRTFALAIAFLSMAAVLALVAYLAHAEALKDAKQEALSEDASRRLAEHPRKGRSWREL